MTPKTTAPTPIHRKAQVDSTERIARKVGGLFVPFLFTGEGTAAILARLFGGSRSLRYTHSQSRWRPSQIGADHVQPNPQLC
jgi:hypothetical protein